MNFLSNNFVKLSINIIRSTNIKSSSCLRRALAISAPSDNGSNKDKAKMEEFNKEKLKERLTPLQYHITQEAGTERPFTGKYNKFYEKGTYVCVVCNQELFNSDTKYDSGCGWPAFSDCVNSNRVTLHQDASLGLVRTEVRCSKCNSHLGHVFGDGPTATKKRYCINSASIEFMEPGSEIKGNK